MDNQQAQNARRPRRHPRGRALVMALLLLMLTSGFLFLNSAYFRVDTIDIRGLNHTTAKDVQAAGDLHTGQHLWLVDPQSVASGIESLPWVKSASVQRQWPGTVVVQVREWSAVAVVRNGKKYDLLNADAGILQQFDQLPDGWPVITGFNDLQLPQWPAGQSFAVPGIKQALDVLVALGNAGQVSVSELHTSSQGIHLYMVDGSQVNWGQPDAQLRSQRAGALLSVWNSLQQAKQRMDNKQINVVIPSRPFVATSKSAGS